MSRQPFFSPHLAAAAKTTRASHLFPLPGSEISVWPLPPCPGSRGPRQSWQRGHIIGTMYFVLLLHPPPSALDRISSLGPGSASTSQIDPPSWNKNWIIGRALPTIFCPCGSLPALLPSCPVVTCPALPCTLNLVQPLYFVMTVIIIRRCWVSRLLYRYP